MASPFTILRKHQKELMVIFTGMAMFSWLVIDSIDGRRGGASPTVMVLFIALLGAGAGYIWNVREKENNNGWLNGAVIGAILGLILMFAARNREPGIATALGKITNQELQTLRSQREMANHFVEAAFFKRENMNGMMAQFLLPRYQFGGTQTQELIASILLEREADQYGITVTNDYINNFIDEISDKRMEESDFLRVCERLEVNQLRLFEVLRKELRIRLAMQLLNPETSYLPEQYWSDFQKFHVRHTIDAVPLPVDAFTADVDAPAEGDLKKLFEEFKSVFPAGSNPGFRVPEKKKLAYVMASFEAFEKKVGDVSEDELKKLYEERKETFYKVESLPDSSLEKLDIKSGSGKASPAGDLILPPPTKPTDEKPAEPNNDKASEKPATPDADKKPADDKKADSEKPADDKKSDTEKPTDSEETQDSNPPPKPEAKTDAKPEAATGDKPASKEAVPAEKPAEKADAATSTDKPAAEKPTSEKPDADKPAEEKSDASKPESGVKYKPFEEVRDELRETIVRQKAQQALKTAVEAARAQVGEAVFQIGAKIADPSVSDKPLTGDDLRKAQAEVNAKKAVELAKHMAEYGKEHGFEFGETKLMSYREFTAAKDEKLASAAEPFDISGGQFKEPRSVPDIVFSGNSTLLAADTAESNGELHFVYWLVEVQEERVAKFEDEGIRDLVEKALRQRRAQPTVEKRANELLTDAKDDLGKKSLSEIVSGKTVTGTKDAEQLTVISTPPFTWLRQGAQGLQMNPFAPPQIEFGFIPGVEKVDQNFMRSVAEMNVGEVKLLSNNDKSTYYIVHVKERTPNPESNDVGIKAMHQQFLAEDISSSRIYRSLAESQAREIHAKWIADFMRKYAVDVNAVDQL